MVVTDLLWAVNDVMMVTYFTVATFMVEVWPIVVTALVTLIVRDVLDKRKTEEGK